MRLDRVAKFDERSRNFRAVAGIELLPLRSYTWSCRVWNDQRNEGACVGFSFSHELAARPYIYLTDETIAFWIYNQAKLIDEWAGEEYEGTSVLAGAKVVSSMLNTQGKPLISEYRWAFGLEDVIRVIGYKGPVVLGVNWYEQMFNTDVDGFIRVGGRLAGGHAILARAVKLFFKDRNKPKTFDNVDLELSYVTLRNSWGRTWGVDGDCKISLSDLDRLLKEQGDACVPVNRNS